MAEKFICALAELGKKAQTEMSRLYDVLVNEGIDGRQTKGLPYHLTLGYFDVSLEEELKDHFNLVSGETSKFSLSFSHLGLFDLNVLFCSPDVNYELLDLKHRICDGRTEESRGWTAHATLVIDDEEKIKRALEVVSNQFVKFDCEVVAISLYEFFPMRLVGRYCLNELV